MQSEDILTYDLGKPLNFLIYKTGKILPILFFKSCLETQIRFAKVLYKLAFPQKHKPLLE
jgi:hypothetical protein